MRADLRFGSLRALRPADAAGMLEWMHDPQTAEHFQADFASMGEDEATAFIRDAVARDEAEDESLHFAAADPATDAYLGTVSLKHVDRANGTAEYAISMRACARGTGAARRATEDVLRFAFDALSLHKVYLNVLATNARAIRFYEKVGFVREGIAREQLRRGTGFADLIWYGILADDDAARALRARGGHVGRQEA